MSWKGEVFRMFEVQAEFLRELRRRVEALEAQQRGRSLLGSGQPEWVRDCQDNTEIGHHAGKDVSPNWYGNIGIGSNAGMSGHPGSKEEL